MKLNKIIPALCLFFILFLTSCGDAPINWTLGEKVAISLGKETMNEQELRLVALVFKTEYEHYYETLLGDGFWEMEIGDNMSYEDFVKESCVFPECKALMYFAEIAEAEGIFISEYEEKDIREAAEKIHTGLSEDEIKYTGAGYEDIVSLLRRYYLANRTIEKLIDGKQIEISDEESRVCDIQVIRVHSEDTARDLYERIKNGENFQTLAKENTLDSRILYTVSREDLTDTVSEIVFSMSDGEVSNIIFFNDSYYLIRMDNSYNSLQSLNNKRNILAELKYNYWEEKYRTYEESIPIRRNENLFRELRLKEEGDFPKVDFFFMFNN